MQNSGGSAAPATHSPASTTAPTLHAPVHRASEGDGTYPRPQLQRPRWASLDGAWGFRFDDADEGASSNWAAFPDFEQTITVPFPPESTASGIGDRGYHRVAWYSRDLTADDLDTAGFEGDGDRLILHFGAVDYRAKVWIGGRFLGGHEGGHTPFSFDITDAVAHGATLVVRVEDDPLDVTQPRGKQEWLEKPHEVWYDRTTGIWQTVWLEAVPAVSVGSVHWRTDLDAGTVSASIRLDGLRGDADVSVALSLGDEALGSASAVATRGTVEVVVALPLLANGQWYEKLLWSPEHPRLVDATMTVGSEGSVDVAYSYLGMRSVAVDRGVFLLNDRPRYLRSVLSQGFWPESHLAAPSVDALRAEAQLIKDLGFNSARIHQKIEDPRFLFWADKLGLLVWEEMPSAFEYSPTTAARLTREWLEAVERDRSHPSIVTWVPLNESWGVQHIASDPAMAAFATGLYHLTKSLDPTRPVISNDGWEHTESDIWSIHDYEASGSVVAERYSDDDARTELLTGFGPAGRRVLLGEPTWRGQPVMLTEFGGVRFTPGDDSADAWGYSTANSADDYRERVASLVTAVRGSRFLAGYCYTQLTDTQQEANGLVDEHRTPKLPLEELHAIFGA